MVPLYNDNPTLSLLALLVPGLPLLSFVLCWLFPRRLASIMATTSTSILFLSVICAAILMTAAWGSDSVLIPIYWFALGDYSTSANLLISNTSLMMMAVVSLISFLVHLYSTGYMEGDAHVSRYFAMLGFFTFSMQGIVLSDNLLVLFIFWELVGFSSYILVGHWMERPSAAKAAYKAFLVNRIGDAGFLAGLMIIWAQHGTFNISELLIAAPGGWQTAAAICIFCGVAGKSAQVPLFTWLPDAMEGPTPVSALIHAATMVAAGVYLLARTLPVFTPDALVVVAVTGLITAIVGSVSALAQFDIKKVLAYSTISQLGLMVMAMGTGHPEAALLHLFTHAFFKACLFLSAGNIIHSLHHARQHSSAELDAQDIRHMGGLRRKLPVTFLAFLAGGASLAGVPFFSGFLSKESILTALWADSSSFSKLIFGASLVISFLTVLYTFRLIRYVFLDDQRTQLTEAVREPGTVMRLPVIILAIGSLWLVVGWNPFSFDGWLFPVSADTHLPWLTVVSVAWVALAAVTAYLLYRRTTLTSSNLLENAFYFDQVTRALFGKIAHSCADAAHHIDKRWIDRLLHGAAYAHVGVAHITGWVDRAIVDGTVNGIAAVSRGIGSFTRSFQGGKIQLYIFWAILAIIIFLIWTLN